MSNEPQDFDDMVFHNMIGWRDKAAALEIERDAFCAENKRLREVLQSLMNEYGGTTSVAPDSPRAAAARAVLEVKP